MATPGRQRLSGWCGPWLAAAVLGGWWGGWWLFDLRTEVGLAVGVTGVGLVLGNHFRRARWRSSRPLQTSTVLMVWILLGVGSGFSAAHREAGDRAPASAFASRLFWLRVTEEVRSGDRVGWQGRVLAYCDTTWQFEETPWRARGWDSLPRGLYLAGGRLRPRRTGARGPESLRLRTAYAVDSDSLATGLPAAERLPVRQRLAQQWNQELRPPAGELAAWTILGVPPRDRTRWKQPFLESGTAHLLAISGLHLGLLIVGLGTILRLLSGGRASSIWTLVALGVYATWIGWPASVRRAGLMTAFSLSGPGWGRYGRVWNGLGWAVAVLPLVDPSSPRQVGFLFSVSATVGVLLGSEWAASVVPPGLPRWCRSGLSAFGASLGASLLTAPATFWVAAWLPVAGVGINLLAIPIMAIVFPILVFASVLVTLGWTGPNPLTTSAEVLSAYLIACIDEASVWGRNTAWAGSEDWAGAWGGTLLCGGLFWGLTRLTRTAQVWSVLAVLVLMAHSGHQHSPPLRVTWLAVGQGDAVLLEAGSSRWLFDVGPPGSPAPVVRALLERGVARIDRVWISHGDLDHWGGWEDLLASPIRVDTLTLARPGREHLPDSFWEAVERAARHRQLPVIDWVGRGERRPLGPHHLGEVLHPRRSSDATPGGPVAGAGPRGTLRNSVSIVLSIFASQNGPEGSLVLLTADLGQEQEAEVLAQYPDLKTVVLHAGHHGSGGSTSDAWLAGLNPALAVVSAGSGNRYGLPDPELLGRLSQSGVRTLRTDREGSISLCWRGSIPTVRRPSLTFSETDR